MQHGKDDKYNSISMQNFLDFLKITCQVHESITAKEGCSTASALDYNKLAKNELVNSLLSSKAPSSLSPKAAESDNSAGTSNNSFDKKGLICCFLFCYSKFGIFQIHTNKHIFR